MGTPIFGAVPRATLLDASGLSRGSPVEFPVVVHDLTWGQASAHLNITIALSE